MKVMATPWLSLTVEEGTGGETELSGLGREGLHNLWGGGRQDSMKHCSGKMRREGGAIHKK